ncbi:MAG: tyrosine-type recombinase/integrase [Planctomycetes bacterium]|nr:tyrosine-type recombinase/integrase [Planctomycetota bacterium]
MGNVHRALVAAGKRAGLPMPTNGYTLRHTFASWIVQRTGNVCAVRDLLGHASVRTTELHYAALAPSSLRSAVEVLPA